jgi:hypothetical protein
MADVCDLAADHMEAEAAHRAILHSRAAATRELTPKGSCHNPMCDMPFEDEDELGRPMAMKLFCDQACSAEYESCKGGNRRFN